MKLRVGFVSNSSSSSYIVGQCSICYREIQGCDNHYTYRETQERTCSLICHDQYMQLLQEDKEPFVIDLMIEQIERFKLMDI